MYIYHPNSTSRTDIDAAYLLVNYTLVAIEIIVSASSNVKAVVTPQSVLNLQKSAGANTKASATPSWNLNMSKLAGANTKATVGLGLGYSVNVVARGNVVARTQMQWTARLVNQANVNSLATFSMIRTTILYISSLVNAKALVTVGIPAIEIFATASTLTVAKILPNWILNLAITSRSNVKAATSLSWNPRLLQKAEATSRATTTQQWNSNLPLTSKVSASALAALALSYSINVVARSDAKASAAITYPLNIYVTAAALAKMPIQVGVGYQIVKRADAMVYLELTVEMTEATMTTRTWQEWKKGYKKKAASFQA